MPSISRISSAERCWAGSRPTSATRRLRSSRRCASSTGSCSGLRDISKIFAGGGTGRGRGAMERVWGHRAAKVVDAAVVGHPVEPGADVHLARVSPQGAEGADEHVLQHVLGVLAAV